jgi:hypothetical protein
MVSKKPQFSASVLILEDVVLKLLETKVKK